MSPSYTEDTTAWDKRSTGWVSLCQPRPISNFPARCMIRPHTHPTRFSDSATVCTPLSFQDTLRGTWASRIRVATGLSRRCPWPDSYPIRFAFVSRWRAQAASIISVERPSQPRSSPTRCSISHTSRAFKVSWPWRLPYAARRWLRAVMLKRVSPS